MSKVVRTASRMAGFDKATVWTIMTPLAVKTKSINLGQGFPSWSPPDFYLKHLREAMDYSKSFLTKAPISMAELSESCPLPRQLLSSTSLPLERSTMKTRSALLAEELRGSTAPSWESSTLERKPFFSILPTIATGPRFKWLEARPSEFPLFLGKWYKSTYSANQGRASEEDREQSCC